MDAQLDISSAFIGAGFNIVSQSAAEVFINVGGFSPVRTGYAVLRSGAVTGVSGIRVVIDAIGSLVK